MAEEKQETENKPVTTISSEEQLAEATMKKIVEGLMNNGKLIVLGVNGSGKTNAVFYITRYLMNTKEYKENRLRIRICDSVGIWRWTFDKVAFLDTSKSRNMPEDEGTLILDLPFSDTDINTGIIEALVRSDYVKQREDMIKNNGQASMIRTTIIEEAQNVLQSGKQSKFWLKMLSESRNQKMFMIFICQRLADLSTRAVERCKYWIMGNVVGDNDEAKLRRAFGKRGKAIVEVLMSLQRGEFLFLDRENPELAFKIKFPLFVQNGVPYEWNEKANGSIRVERVFV